MVGWNFIDWIILTQTIMRLAHVQIDEAEAETQTDGEQVAALLSL